MVVETIRSHERPGVFSLPWGADVAVEPYGGAVTLWLGGEGRRVHMRQFCIAIVDPRLRYQS